MLLRLKSGMIREKKIIRFMLLKSRPSEGRLRGRRWRLGMGPSGLSCRWTVINLRESSLSSSTKHHIKQLRRSLWHTRLAVLFTQDKIVSAPIQDAAPLSLGSPSGGIKDSKGSQA